MKNNETSLLQATNITKVFPGVTALDAVDFDLVAGEVHCIVGENGAGKSTLIKCLTGNYVPELGEITISGQSALDDDELFKKVAYVPQEIDLFADMTVAENLLMPFDRTGITGRITANKLNKIADPILREYGINARPETAVKKLSVADQQLLQIARASQYTAQVLILDEPTSSLTDDDAVRVLEVVNRAKAQGMGVIYISHKLDELGQIGDRVSVFRNGKHVATAPMEQADNDWLVREMTGRDVAVGQTFIPENPTDEVIMSVTNVSGPGFADVSFDLLRGEVLGVSGLIGAGRTELMLSLFGYAPLFEGTVAIGGKETAKRDPLLSLEEGLAYLPEDRKRMGILERLPVSTNISALSLDQFARMGFMDTSSESKAVREAAEEYDVRTGSLETQIKYLSGGNQQKAIIARIMMMNPKIVILDEPTKGIDVSAKYEIYTLIRELAQSEGIGVILVSSELDEIVNCSNRILVMHAGRVSGRFENPVSKETLVSAMFGQNSEEASAR